MQSILWYLTAPDTFEDETGEEYEGSAFGGFSDYFRRKKLKLQNLDVEIRTHSSHNPPIFKGVVAHVNGYTQPSLNDLHNLIVSHGGGFMQYLDGKTAVTHVIASNLTPKKKVDFARYRIVKPAWVVDSVKTGKLLPWDAYRVVDEGVTQKVLGFDNGRVVSQSNTQRSSYRDQTETSWYTSQIRGDVQKEVAPTVSSGRLATEPEDTKPTPNQQSQSLPSSDSSTPDDGSITLLHSSTQRDLSFLADETETEEDADTEQDVALSKVEPINQEQSSARPEGENLFGDTRPDSRTENQQSSRDGSPTPNEAQPEGAAGHDGLPRPPSALEAKRCTRESQLVSPEKRKLTAEEHNARLLSDPHLAKSSTANPDFLNQYYRESRLHHLSTWKAELKAQLQSLTNAQTSSQKARQKRPPGARRYIMHVDFDSFFAAVSLRKHPDLVDKPVAIAHGTGPGSEIASCNYPAREFGVKNGMWMKYALQLCPDLKALPYDYNAYEEASRHFYDAILATDGIVQSVSIDEALVDISNQCIVAGGTDGKAVSEGSTYQEQTKADEIASNLRALIKEKTGCAVSVGIGNNILLAKVALRKAKPAGQHQIKPKEVLDFIGELTVQDLPGVAYSLGGKLEEIGVKYVRDIRGLTKERLVSALGPKTGERLWDYARGIDKTEVGEQAIRKSVSAEVNWGIRFVTQEQADEFVQCLCDELSRRLLEQAVKGKQLTMKIMKRAADAPIDPPKNLGHGKCDTFNKSVVLGVATNDKAVIGKEALSILKGFGFSPGELRGLGVQMQKLEPLKALGKPYSPNVDSSQRRLQFKQPSSLPTQQGHISSSKNRKSTTPPAQLKKPTKIQDHVDPIERSPSPEERIGSEPTIQGALSSKPPGVSESTYKPLNITGTQFILPTQIDPSVLAELPSDIRSKLAPKQKRIVDTLTDHRSPSPAISRPHSPVPSDPDLPNLSQLDPETLNALPEDVRNELLSFYHQSKGSKSKPRPQQQLLPQSPRKPKPILKRPTLTPSKKQKTFSNRGRPPKTNIKSTTTSSSTLTQSNFIAKIPNAHKPTITYPKDADVNTTTADPDPLPFDPTHPISESFLSALPPDLRHELLTQHRRERLKQRSGLDILSSRKRTTKAAQQQNDEVAGQRKLMLPPRAEQESMPTFTSKKLWRIEDVREVVGEWVREFSTNNNNHDEDGESDFAAAAASGGHEDGGDSAPYPEDVDALATYLRKVVLIEKNMQKAVSLVKWVGWLVAEMEERARERGGWGAVVERLKSAVEEAVGERGIGVGGVLDFG